MLLTPHFSLDELAESDTALRLGIDNTPPERLLPNLRRTAELGEAIRAALSEKAGREVPLLVTSGFRCEALERILCASAFERWCGQSDMDPRDPAAWRMYFRIKAHPDGRGLDFKAPGFGTPREVVGFIAACPEIMEKVDQIIMEGNWVHVAWSDAPRHAVMEAFS